MPNRVSSFVGREDDIDRLLALVDHNQIVTLTGVGGAGKTSLAIEVARRSGERFTNGVVFVELAGLTDQRHAPQAVADALGLAVDPTAADGSLTTQLVAYLENRSLLLVIDNCEHVIQACAELVHAVTVSSSSAHTLATSREALGVPGEVVYRLQPLSIPPEDAEGEDLRAFASVRLFLDRMFAADPMRAIQTREGDEELVAAICRSLDGIPLAIELAAARSAALSLGDIADRLADLDRFSLLTLGPRTADARQRTLRATVDWSYRLLSGPERLLFRRLAVFRGGWTLAAAERVTAGTDLNRRDVTHLLGQLVHRSLVVPEPGPLARFTLLETIRVYALEQLVEAGEADEMGARHAGWVLGLAEESEVALRGHEQTVWLSRLQAELDNIRAALGWAFEAPADRADEALLLVGSLGWFYHLGRHMEGRDLFAQLRAVPGGSEPARARAHLARAVVGRPRSSLVHPDPECAQAAATSLELFSRLGDRARAALARTLLAVEGVAGMPLEEALSHLDLAEDEFRSLEDRWGHALAAFVRLALEIKRGTPEGAREWGQRAVALYLEAGDHAGLAAVRFHQGLALRQSGLHRDAIDEFLEAARVAEPLKLYAIVHWSLTAAGVSALGLDELDEAATLFDRAARTRSERGDPSVAGHAAQGAALIAPAR
jgi:predicted ATPase